MWLIFCGLLISLSLVETYLLEKLFTDPVKRISATFVSLIVTRGILFIWLLVGLFRANEKDYLEYGNTLKTRAIQAMLIVSVIFTLVYSIETIQAAVFNKKQLELAKFEESPPNYFFQLKENATQLSITGELELGITEKVRQIVQSDLPVKDIVLNSEGGIIHEGRGLSLTFSEFHLNTYVFGECSSACTTAFIGGEKRIIGKNAKIGFHQYKQDTKKYPKAVPYHDLKAEQQRDLEIFKSRGVDEAFLKKVFNQSAEDMWFPTAEELLSAGVIHGIIE